MRSYFNRNPKILILEDDKALNSLIDIKIRAGGFETICMYNGRDALNYIRENIDLLVIMDYQLPDIHCRDLVLQLHSEQLYFPFIVITGFGDERIAVEMMKLGALDYIVKDIGFADQLISVINKSINHLEIKRLLRESQLELKEREEKYRRIFENIQDVYFELDHKGNIIEISPSVEDILFFIRNDIIGSNIFKEHSHGFTKKQFYDLLKENKEIKDLEIKVADNKKEEKFLAVTCKLIDGDDGMKVIGIFRDITQRKLLEYKVMNSVIEAEERERQRFAEDLHDGLGPLLSGIKLYVNLLDSEKKTAIEKLEIINNIRDLLDESVQHTRTIATTLMPPTLNDYGLVKAIESFCKKMNAADLFNISFTHNLKERLPNMVEIIIYRSIIELLNNTIKYARAKNVTIDIQLKKELLIVKYSDDGSGFEPGKALQNGFGLKSITDRIESLKGICKIRSSDKKGVNIEFRIDLKYIIVNKT
ncbi:MAG: PAS domain S-box protein [Bacteroidota bacterium]